MKSDRDMVGDNDMECSALNVIWRMPNGMGERVIITSAWG